MPRESIPHCMRSPRTLFESDTGHCYVESFFDGTSRWVYMRATGDGKKRPSDPTIVISQDELVEIVLAISKDAARCEQAKRNCQYYDELPF